MMHSHVAKCVVMFSCSVFKILLVFLTFAVFKCGKATRRRSMHEEIRGDIQSYICLKKKQQGLSLAALKKCLI